MAFGITIPSMLILRADRVIELQRRVSPPLNWTLGAQGCHEEG
jgi:hypothetical protein